MTRAYARTHGLSIAAMGRLCKCSHTSMREWAWVDTEATQTLSPDNIERLFRILMDDGLVKLDYDIRKIERMEDKPAAPMTRTRRPAKRNLLTSANNHGKV
jgi:hypothetical protein